MYKIDLTKGQFKKMIEAIQKDSPINLRLKANQIKGNKGVDLQLNATQKKKVDKARKNKKGMMLKFTKSHIKKMKKGGILPILAALAPFAIAALTGAAGAAGTFGATKGLEAIERAIEKGKEKKGSALFPPGFTGQTGNAIVGFRPTGRGQAGGRRDARKPAKPAMRHYQDFLTPDELDFEARRQTEASERARARARQMEIIRKSDEMRKREEERLMLEKERNLKKIQDFKENVEELSGQGLRPFGNGLSPFGTGLNPIGIRIKRGSALFPHGVNINGNGLSPF